MRTDEDFLRLESENRFLRERLNAGPEIANDMKLAIAEFLAPRTREPWELPVVARVLATAAGVPQLCGRRECSRDGHCHAEGSPPPCREHWSKSLSMRFDDVATGVEVSLFRQQQEAASLHAWACEQLGLTPDGKLPPKKPGRKSSQGL
jgi:hypothetical protein